MIASFIGDFSLVLVGFWLGAIGAAVVIGVRELAKIREIVSRHEKACK